MFVNFKYLLSFKTEQANYIKSKIQMNPTDFYCRVVDYIIENEEYVPSAAEEQGLF